MSKRRLLLNINQLGVNQSFNTTKNIVTFSFGGGNFIDDNVFNNNDMFLKDRIDSQLLLNQSNIFYGEEEAEFWDPNVGFELSRSDKQGLFFSRLSDFDPQSILLNNDQGYALIDGKRYDPISSYRIVGLFFNHSASYRIAMDAVTNFTELVPDDDSIRIYVDFLTTSEISTIRSAGGVSTTTGSYIVINDILREIQTNHGNSALNKVQLNIYVEKSFDRELTTKAAVFRIKCEIDTNQKLYVKTGYSTALIPQDDTENNYLECFASSNLFYKKIVSAIIDEKGPQLVSFPY